MIQNFNIEIFKKFQFDADAAGNPTCPESSCTFVIHLADDQDAMNDEQKQAMWIYVQENHPDIFGLYFQYYSTKPYIPVENKIDRAFELVSATYGKINKILWQIGKSINEQQAIQLIKDENKKMEHELAQLFGEFSGPSQSLTTSSLSSL